MTDPLTIWVGAIVTLVVFSYLVRDNPAYRLVQQATLGTAVGINTVILWKQVLYARWLLPIYQGWLACQADGGAAQHPEWRGLLWLLALIPGVLWYFQLSRRWSGASTLITGLFVGAAAGLAIKYQTLLIIPQIAASVRPLNPCGPDGAVTAAAALAALNNVVFLAMLFATLLYFFFSVRTDRAAFRAPLRFGRLAIMMCLGALFGGTVMTRVAYLLDRVLFLYQDWLRAQVLPLVGW